MAIQKIIQRIKALILACEFKLITPKKEKGLLLCNTVSIVLLLFCFGFTSFESFMSSKSKNDFNVIKDHFFKNADSKKQFVFTRSEINFIANVAREVIQQGIGISLLSKGKFILLHDYAITVFSGFFLVGSLKILIHKKRSDGSDAKSFPSGHSSQLSLCSTFIAKNFGILASIPFYVITVLVSIARVYTKKHDLIDVSVGLYLGVLIALYCLPTIKWIFDRLVRWSKS